MIKGETSRSSFHKLTPASLNVNAVSMATRGSERRPPGPVLHHFGSLGGGSSERFSNKGGNLQSVFESYPSSLQLSSV